MLVAELMKTEVVTVAPETSLADAVRIMLVQRVSGLPVLDAGRLVGVITGGDVLRRIEIGSEGKPAGRFKAFFAPAVAARDYVHTHGVHVRDVMSMSPLSVAPDTEIAQAAEIMVARRVKRLPVLQDDILVGVISRTDVLRVLARRLIAREDPLSECQIQAQIMSTLQHERWAPKSGIRVRVVGDTVDLSGTVFSEAERRAINVIAETTPGVAKVNDHLELVDHHAAMAYPVA